MQEAAIARECHFYWGPNHIQISQLFELVAWLNTSRTNLRSRLEALTGHLYIGELVRVFTLVYSSYRVSPTWKTSMPLIRTCYDHYKPPSFSWVLSGGREANSSDTRDHVYALLGSPFAKQGSVSELIVQPDYTKPVEKVYFDVACAFTKSSRSSVGADSCLPREP